MNQAIGAEAILKKRKQYFYPCTAHFYKQPPQIVRGRMQYLYDDNGKQYLDCFSGVSVVACGHCNEEITRATIRQLETLQHTTTLYLTQPMADLCERLERILPGQIRRTFFCNSGSEANEGVLLHARLYTGRRNFIALDKGLHGRTYLTMGVTGLPMWRADDYLDAEVSFISRPHDVSLTSEEAAHRSLDELKRLLEEKGETFAAMIVEPVQGNGGMIVPAPWYFREVKALLKQYGILLIADEIQTGFGRTGRMFAMEHFGVVPDILSMAKALGNGIPISCFSTTDEIASAFNRPSASTFGGNPVSSATAIAVLEYIQEHNLAECAESLGNTLMHGLNMMLKYKIVSEVRGLGLMVGVEICAENPERGAVLVDRILEEMKDRGYLIGKNGVGRNVLAFQPPLVITEEDLNSMLVALDEVIAGCQS